MRTSLPRENYAVTFSSTDGYKQTATITLGPLVLGNDSDLMESEWASVGGRGAIPCLDALVNGYAVVQTTLAGYAFGTMTITNDVPSFAPSAVSYYFDTNGLDAPFLVMGVGYSSGSTCSDGDLTASPSFSITPDWGDGTRATWGPVPIVIVMANVRAPAYPNGDAGKVASAEPLRVSTVGGSNAVDIPLSLYTP